MMGYLVYKWVLWVWTWSLTFAWQALCLLSHLNILSLCFDNKNKTSNLLKIFLSLVSTSSVLELHHLLVQKSMPRPSKDRPPRVPHISAQAKSRGPHCASSQAFLHNKTHEDNIVFQKQTSKSIVPWSTAKGSFTHTYER